MGYQEGEIQGFRKEAMIELAPQEGKEVVFYVTVRAEGIDSEPGYQLLRCLHNPWLQGKHIDPRHGHLRFVARPV